MLVFAPTLTPISEIGLYSLIVLLPKQQFRVTYTKLLHFDFTVMSSLFHLVATYTSVLYLPVAVSGFTSRYFSYDVE